MSDALVAAFELLQSEKGISAEVIQEALESALVSAYKKEYGTSQNVEVKFDVKTGNIAVYQMKDVVEVVENENLEISLEDAKEKNFAYEIGDKIRFEVTPKNFGRLAASTAKQVITQRLREAERSVIYQEYIQYEDDLMTGIVERQDNNYVFINLGKVEAVMSERNQIEGEVYKAHDRIKVYVNNVQDSTKGPQVFVSRTHPNLVKRLFEQEVPEIYDGIVEIMSISREAGDRSKLAVFSHDENVDAVGTCVGPKGVRVQSIVNELNGENMDIVEWDEDPVVFIKNALNPAEVIDVYINEEEHECVAVVPDTQLSLAIGRRGQNVRLAARLTGYKIDIKSESDFDPEEYAELEATKDITEDSEEEEISSDRSIEPILDESEDFFDTLEDMAEESEPEEVEDTEDFFDIFDDQQDEDSPVDSLAIDTDEDTPREHDEVMEELEDEHLEEPIDSDEEIDEADDEVSREVSEDLEEIDEELDEQE
ncbi:NusA antitermination factor [Atopostipes suicloacalis DSM 15692]|uniref:Transcription termination/antitermination protein NusA n=1 Tax=Atopostipes suicloacalis DSM 15692 TaxID=1121025 RepID=A0A1M4TGW2_9LACT|nr:transcription termination factor NusA [Atopostipes suicloacalis]SHE43713.1 NusA antitermination factor [Atopostipes suicloacalis DSM 15692]